MHRPKTGLSRLLVALPLLLTPVFASAGPEPAPAPAASPAASASDGRVVVLGFDGADARTIRELMAANPGRFPTFERLSQEGTFAPLQVVAPPESPVSWAALNTGQNPAKTGVPGFIKRQLPNPIPTFGHIVSPDVRPLESFDDLPTLAWPHDKSMGLLGGGGFVVGLLLGLLLFKRKLVPALVLGLLAGGGMGYWGFWAKGQLPSEIPVTGNPNQAENFWDVTARAGVPTVVLDAAQAFDMPAPDGAKVLAGLGLPDARGGLGDWFVYTTNPDEDSREGRSTTTAGTVFRVDQRGDEIHTTLWGPKNFWAIEKAEKELEEISEKLRQNLSMDETLELSSRQQELKPKLKKMKRSSSNEGRTSLPLEIVVRADEADVTIGSQTQTVKLGTWSEFYELNFQMNSLLSAHALTRVRLVKTEPYFELFVNVEDIDPRNPPFWQPISSPHDFSAELAKEAGLYETYGWPTLTMPVKDGEVDPELLMEDVEFTMKWRERLTKAVLERDDWRVFMSVFCTTDRVQHMMYRFWDTEHPEYDAEIANREMTFFGKTMKLSEAIPSIYEQMDRVIGEVLAKLDPNDTLLVCSDHGFQSFRRQVNVNNWLIENGYLAMKPGTNRSTKSFLQFVDWPKTKVYSLGMGFLYLNLRGREAKGIVDPSEADALMAEVREKFLAATDQDNGTPICKSVYVTKDMHSGPYLDLESDMILGFAPTYRVSWSSTSGGVHLVKDDNGEYALGPVCTDNDSPWSGGHISVNLPDVAGVFFCNRKVDLPAEGAQSLALAPTILSLVGVDKTPEMDMEPLTVH